MLDAQIQSYSGPLVVDTEDETSNTKSLRPDQNDVRVSNTGSSDGTIYLPPVSQCRGKRFFFLKTDSGTQSVFIRPKGYVTSSLTGGDSFNWDGGEGYDMDAQYDDLWLESTGDAWVTLKNGIA